MKKDNDDFNFNGLETPIVGLELSGYEFEVVESSSESIWGIFEDRTKSLLERWATFRNNHPEIDKVDAICIEGFLKEINDDYTKMLLLE